MRFSDKRYYIEAYIKCVNCGVLVYEQGVEVTDASGRMQIYCSDWCREWAVLRQSGEQPPKLPLPRN